ncbi:hypothetical protein evm_012441 [Chilo suppressalis]|nr:hypothetical protein evm_012441 [Chilo suppressalis]
MAATSVFCAVVFAVVTFANAQLKDSCAVDTYGDLKGAPIQLKPVPLTPPVSAWDITIPEPCDVAGVTVKLCDPDSPPEPTVKLVSKKLAVIRRNGSPIAHSAKLDITVFCKFSNPVGGVIAVPKAFLMDGIGRLGHDPPRGPSADWWVLTTADAAETNGLTCLPKHGGARDTNFWSPIQ